MDITGKHVLIIEDIVDTGQTAAVLIQHIQEKKPSSVRLCALLHKEVSKLKFPIDYVGFKIPNRYVVGYGMDFNGLYRNLPYIGILQK